MNINTHKGSVYSMKRNSVGELQCNTKSENDTLHNDVSFGFGFSLQSNVSCVCLSVEYMVLGDEIM